MTARNRGEMSSLRTSVAGLRAVEKAMGALLVLAGVAFLTGLHQTFSYWLLETFPIFTRIG